MRYFANTGYHVQYSVICVCHYHCFEILVSPMCVAYGTKLIELSFYDNLYLLFSRKNGSCLF